ncbi:MAG: hypothetical protein U9P70_04845 [Patescibacteria group bacterium]|nr:hypothetical protein [Patescibacteria group bacterium]
MNEEFIPTNIEAEPESIELEPGDEVVYTDPEGNEENCKVTRAEGDLHLGKGLVEIEHDDGDGGVFVEGVDVKNLKKVKKAEMDEE